MRDEKLKFPGKNHVDREKFFHCFQANNRGKRRNSFKKLFWCFSSSSAWVVRRDHDFCFVLEVFFTQTSQRMNFLLVVLDMPVLRVLHQTLWFLLIFWVMYLFSGLVVFTSVAWLEYLSHVVFKTRLWIFIFILTFASSPSSSSSYFFHFVWGFSSFMLCLSLCWSDNTQYER